MEPPQRRDISELLVNGYFKTSRARSPAGPASSTPTRSSPALLQTQDVPRNSSRSREPRGRVAPRPPKPTVEDEEASLSRESLTISSIVSYDPPLRGIIDQNPIILEADVSADEAARLHAAPCPKEDDNPERRFVFIPKTDTYSDDDAPKKRVPVDPRKQEPVRRDGENLAPRPPMQRRPSRQDLPSLVTKVPRDIPPQFRRSASAQGPVSRDSDFAPRPQGPRTPGTGEFLLSPDVPRGKDYFGIPSAPRYRAESAGGRNGTPAADKRMSGGVVAGTPRSSVSSEKRNSGNFEKPRSRRGTNEKMTRPQQLPEEEYRRERHASSLAAPTGDRRSSGRSSSRSRRHHHSSSDSDLADSDSDRGHKHRHRRHRELQVDDAHRRSSSRANNRSSVDLKPRYNTSPLPSPKVSPSQVPTRPSRGLSPRGDRERAETFPQRSGSRSPVSRPVSPFSPTDETSQPYDRLNPMDAMAGPRSRQFHTVSTPSSSTPSSSFPATLPIAIPLTCGPADPQRLPSFPQYDESRAQGSRPGESNRYWQPPPFQPPNDNLNKPIGTYRRHSEDVESGTIAPLPTCPRTKFTRGRTDWLTLPHSKSFDMCPSCFNSTIANTELRSLFVPAPRRSLNDEVLCDFGSSPWYRIAWLLTRKERRKDLNLFYSLENIALKVPECAGKHERVGPWHSLIDPKTRTPIKNFDVCLSCVKSIETLLPPIRGIFVRTDSKRPMEDRRVCDLRFDSKRFIQYFDALETTADEATREGAPPDTRAIVSFAKRMSLYPECEGSTDLIDARWNVITQLPDFTVCEECFEDIVWPELEERKPIPMMFNKNLQRISRASCQLYSKKMRGIFRTAVDGDDYKLLASKARERKAVELAYKATLNGNRRGDPVEGKRIEEEWRKWE